MIWSVPVQKVVPIRSERHRRFVASLPCVICGKQGATQAAHVRYHSIRHGKPMTGTGIKPGDNWVVPLCVSHHAEQHANGERHWWMLQGIDPLLVAALLYMGTDDEHAGFNVISAARTICAPWPERGN